MPKQRSNRSAPIKKRAIRKRVLGGECGQTVAARVSTKSTTHYCDLARSQVLAVWPEILQGLIEKAMSGGYQQTKLLLDLCDLASMERDLASMEQPKSSQESKQQLCDALLDGLRLMSPE